MPLTKDIDKLHAKILSLSAGERAPRTITGREETQWLNGLKESMGNRKLTVIANREPYIHQSRGDRIEVVRPASGLVTALEPILRQCGGLWIAHGSGTADNQVVDAQNEVAVPPVSAQVPAPARLADARRGKRLLLRLLQRRLLAALPSGAQSADFPPLGLGEVQEGQPEVHRRDPGERRWPMTR